MTAFARAAALFERMLALPASERDAELAKEGDAEVRELVREMLAGEANLHSALATGLPGAGALIGDALDATGCAGGPGEATDAPRFEQQDGPYRILGVLARGGMGIVLRGHDERLGRDVAIKVLRGGSRDGTEARLRFVEEAQVAGQLEHPGIVPIYHLGEDDRGQPFFAMKLVEGETLAARLASRADAEQDRGRFLALFLRVCQTVAYAHARHVIHRDLKPANVMIGAFGEVQVLDWGLAKVLGTEERLVPRERSALETVRTRSDSSSASITGTVMGTPHYMPPEQALGEVERLDRRSDVFSLGAILCEILTGEPPFTGDRESALRDAREGRLEPAFERLGRCGADPALVALAIRSLAARAKDRPTNAGELADEIERSLEAVERRAHDAELSAQTAMARAAADRRAKRMTVGLAASAACFIVVLAGVFLWRAFERERDELRLSHEVDAALDVADARFASAREGPPDDSAAWDAAELAITSAASLLAGGQTTDEVRERLAALRSEFEPTRSAARTEAERIERDRAMSVRLDDVRAPTGDGRDPYHYPSMNAAYREAFASYGVDLDDPDSARLALEASAIAPALASALDQWALCNQVLSGRTSQERADDTHRLLQLAEAADPHPTRGRIRRALRENDIGTLLSIAAQQLDLEPESFVLLAGGLRINGDDEGAARVLRAATARYPGDFWLAMHSALAERAIVPDMASTRAIAAFRAALAARPSSLEARHLLGQTLMSLERAEEARAVFIELVQLDPQSGHWRTHLGQCVMQLEGPEPALAVFAEATRIAPNDSFALDWYGGCFLNLGAYFSAARVLGQAAEIDRSPSALLRLASASSRAGDPVGSLNAFRRVLADDPEEWSALYGAGKQARDLGMFEAAQEYLRRCTEVRPDFAEAWCNLGWVYFDDGRIEEAVEAFTRGDALGRASDEWRYPSASWLALAERTRRDSEEMATYIDGGFDPADPRALEIVESARLSGRTRAASLWYERIARTGATFSTLDWLLAADASCSAAAGEGVDATDLSDAERTQLYADTLQRLETLRLLLMQSFRDAPAREWSSVRGWLAGLCAGPIFEPVRRVDELPLEVADRARTFWRIVESDLAEVEAYARENH